MSRPFAVVVACDDRFGIGRGGQLPWRLPGEMKHFVATTRGTPPAQPPNAVIMGRVTWESIPERFRPLADRQNIVLCSRDVGGAAEVAPTLDAALERAAGASAIFVIGGAAVYERAVEHPLCNQLYLTRVRGDFRCDRFFPDPRQRFELERVLGSGSDGDHEYEFQLWRRRRDAS